VVLELQDPLEELVQMVLPDPRVLRVLVVWLEPLVWRAHQGLKDQSVLQDLQDLPEVLDQLVR